MIRTVLCVELVMCRETVWCRFRALILTVLRRSQCRCTNISMYVYMYVFIVCVHVYVCVLGDDVVPLQSADLDGAMEWLR